MLETVYIDLVGETLYIDRVWETLYVDLMWETLYCFGTPSECLLPRHRFVLAATGLNSAINEQKNRYINFMKTSVAFMGQARGMVFIRCSP